MYDAMIVTIEVEAFPDGRKVAERIEDRKCDSFNDVMNVIKEELDEKSKKLEDHVIFERIQVWELSNFMDACNNQEINLENVWISYIHLKKA